MIVQWPEWIAGIQTGCRAGVHARIGSGSTTKSHRLGTRGFPWLVSRQLALDSSGHWIDGLENRLESGENLLLGVVPWKPAKKNEIEQRLIHLELGKTVPVLAGNPTETVLVIAPGSGRGLCCFAHMRMRPMGSRKV
jgi:hypothetical protein